MKNEVKTNIKNIIQAKEQNRLVIFVGAGVSKNSNIPFWGELIQIIRDKYLTGLDEKTDYLKVAQLFYNQRGKKEYYDIIKQILLHKKATYNPINEAILSLNPEHIITTNYDDLFEQVISRDRLQYDIIRQNSDFPETTLSTYLIKMHGCFETKNIVFTEDDYLQYSEKFPLVESYVKGLFASRLILFIGFGFSDINLKYILQRVDSVLGKDRQPSYIYIDSPYNELEKDYLIKKGIIPIYFDEIKDYLNDNKFEESKALESRGNKLFRFIKLLEKPTFEKEEFKKLSIIKQLSRSIEPFQDFGFIMPSVYQKLPPFDEKNPSLNEPYNFGYNTDSPSCLQIQNPSLIDLFNQLTRDSTNEKRSIISFQKLESELDGQNIDDKIKELTNNAITHKNDYEELIKVVSSLNKSRISCVNNQYSIWVNDLEKKCNCLSCRYKRLEFGKIIEILNKIEFRNEDISISDDEIGNRMLKGYIAIKMGFAKIGFEELQKVLDLSKSQNREVAYFLAKYNLKYAWRFSTLGDIDNNYLKEIGTNVNLKDILNGLKITNEVREELENIINDKYIYEYLDITRKMRDKIIKNYNLFTNGGSTSGNNEDDVHALLTHLLVIHGFYQDNQILDTEFILFSEFTEICFEGIVYNYITPNPKFEYTLREYPKIKEFQSFIIQIVILYHNPSKLYELLGKLGNKKIKLSEKDAGDFVELVINFFNSFYEETYINDIVPNDSIAKNTKDMFNVLNDKCKKITHNIILLLGYIDLEDLDFDKTIEPIINFLSVHNFDCFNNEEYWRPYLLNHLRKFNNEQKKKLLFQILTNHAYVKPKMVEIFSKTVQKENIVLLDDISWINSFEDKNYYYLEFIYNLFPIANEELKIKIANKVEEMQSANFNSILFYKAVNLKILTPNSFLNEALKEAQHELTNNFDSNYYDISNFLGFLGLNHIDTNDEKFDVFISTNKYIKWLFYFEEFDYSEFDNQWFEYRPSRAFLPKMSKNSEVRKRFELYLKENFKSEFYDMLSKIYFKYFVNS